MALMRGRGNLLVSTPSCKHEHSIYRHFSVTTFMNTRKLYYMGVSEPLKGTFTLFTFSRPALVAALK